MLPLLTSIEMREVQPENAPDPMDVTESGMVTEVSPVQPENALSPMDVTESGMVTEVSPVQPENALPPMDVTESPMVTELSEVQPMNTPFPMDVTESPITTVLTDSRYEYHGISDILEYSAIAPDPLIVSVPVDDSNLYVRFSPHFPESSETAASVSPEQQINKTADRHIIAAAKKNTDFFMINTSPREFPVYRQSPTYSQGDFTP